MLGTQVYSNTDGQESNSSPLPGVFDMIQLGAACVLDTGRTYPILACT